MPPRGSIRRRDPLNRKAIVGAAVRILDIDGLDGFSVKLVELKVRDVDFALGKLAKRLSTRSVRLARMIRIQAFRNAMVNDLVVRNVADLAAVPTGRAAEERPTGPKLTR